MLLERVENGKLVDAIYESSNVLASSYNKETNDLTVTFKNGGSYTYLKVQNTDYLRFETAESQGKILNSKLKSYAFSKNEKVNTEDVLNRIKNLKDVELDSYRRVLTAKMESLVTYFNQSGRLQNNDLTSLVSEIEKYKELNNE